MNLRQRRAFAKLNSLIYKAITTEPTQANFQCIDSDATLDINGDFSMLQIKFTGNIYIYNKLPDGFGISVNKDTIIIRNILNRKIDNGLLFQFSGSFSPKRVHVSTFTGNNIVANVFNKNEMEIIDTSKTNLEDDTLILNEPVEPPFDLKTSTSKNFIDDDTIYGLYTSTPINGYTGYYNYHPRERIYMTGKRLTNESKPINTGVNKTPKKMQLLKNVYKKLIATNIRQRAIKKTLQPAEVKEKIQIKRDYKKKDTTGGKY